MICAIDQSTKSTGITVYDEIHNKIVFYDTLKESSKLDVHIRIHHMKERIFEIVKKYKCDKLVLEEIYCHANARGIITLAHFAGSIIEECISTNIVYDIILASRWRKILGINHGKREQQKQNAINFCKDKFNIEFTSKEDDVSESMCIAYAYSLLIKEGCE